VADHPIQSSVTIAATLITLPFGGEGGAAVGAGGALLDTNAVIAAVEGGNAVAVDAALAGGTPYVSPTVIAEFTAGGGDSVALDSFLAQRGGGALAQEAEANAATLQAQATAMGRTLGANDAAIACAGFYEWQLQDDGNTKIPYYITTNDQATFAIAGIWESSRPEVGDPIESAALITLPANEVIASIHNSGANAHRMPAILRVEDREKWLNGTPDEAYALLKPYAEEHTVAWPVSTRVNRPGNNDPTLIEPLDPPRAEAL